MSQSAEAIGQYSKSCLSKLVGPILHFLIVSADRWPSGSGSGREGLRWYVGPFRAGERDTGEGGGGQRKTDRDRGREKEKEREGVERKKERQRVRHRERM